MNVLLIYPEFPDTFWSFKHALKFVRKRATLPPLGLLTVAAMLPEGWGKRLVDLNVRALREDDLAWADCAFVSAMVVQRDAARRAIRRCKDAGLRVVAGGPLFTSEHEQFDEVDHFVLGEAEVLLPGFIADLERGEPGRLYESDELADMHKSPIPAWRLMNRKHYVSMSVQFSRGCPYDCEFCNVAVLFGPRQRAKTTGQIIAELDSLYEWGWRGSVFFVDDNFIGNKRILKSELLPALIDWQERRHKSGITFYTEASINLADDDDLMAMMVQAGFDQVFVGIETPDEESLKECSKRHNQNRDMLADVKRIQRAGLQVQGGFIVGFDSDTTTIFERQIQFIQKSGIVTAMVGLLQAIPGTRLAARLKREGRLDSLPTGDNVDGTVNFAPRMGRETLKEGYKALLKHIYSPRGYYERLRVFLREYKAPRIRQRLRAGDLMAFARSMVRIGIIGRERFHYWKLLAWTSFRRPRLLSLAVTLAICGQHFRKVCERHVL